jgi:hypothetical protein
LPHTPNLSVSRGHEPLELGVGLGFGFGVGLHLSEPQAETNEKKRRLIVRKIAREEQVLEAISIKLIL